MLINIGNDIQSEDFDKRNRLIKTLQDATDSYKPIESSGIISDAYHFEKLWGMSTLESRERLAERMMNISINQFLSEYLPLVEKDPVSANTYLDSIIDPNRSYIQDLDSNGSSILGLARKLLSNKYGINLPEEKIQQFLVKRYIQDYEQHIKNAPQNIFTSIITMPGSVAGQLFGSFRNAMSGLGSSTELLATIVAGSIAGRAGALAGTSLLNLSGFAGESGVLSSALKIGSPLLGSTLATAAVLPIPSILLNEGGLNSLRNEIGIPEEDTSYWTAVASNLKLVLGSELYGLAFPSALIFAKEGLSVAKDGYNIAKKNLKNVIGNVKDKVAEKNTLKVMKNIEDITFINGEIPEDTSDATKSMLAEAMDLVNDKLATVTNQKTNTQTENNSIGTFLDISKKYENEIPSNEIKILNNVRQLDKLVDDVIGKLSSPKAKLAMEKILINKKTKFEKSIMKNYNTIAASKSLENNKIPYSPDKNDFLNIINDDDIFQLWKKYSGNSTVSKLNTKYMSDILDVLKKNNIDSGFLSNLKANNKINTVNDIDITEEMMQSVLDNITNIPNAKDVS